jgi:biotin carboxylase
MREALAAFEVKGIKTTVPFHKVLFASKDFVDARFDTTYLEAHMSQLRGEIGE